MISYIKALKQYESLIGLKEGVVLVLSILAVKIGLTLNKKSQRLLERWSSFQALFGEESIRVLVAGDHEFKLNYEANQSGKIGVNLVLRVPASESSDLLVFNQIFLKQEYQHVLDWFSTVCPHGKISTIVDLGSNIGCATLFFSTRFPEASIFSLEPEAGNYARLRRNLELNSDRKIKSYPAAVWIQTCKLRCRHDFRDKKEWSSSFVESTEDNAASAPQVDAMDIRTLMKIAGFARVDLLKMDVEGAEAALFKNTEFKYFLKGNVFRIAVEVHEEFIKIKEVVDVLQSLEFETAIVDEFVCGIKNNV